MPRAECLITRRAEFRTLKAFAGSADTAVTGAVIWSCYLVDGYTRLFLSAPQH
jgi:hypothetical protein